MSDSSQDRIRRLRKSLPGLGEDFLRDFAARLPARYFARFSASRQAAHASALSRLSADNPVELILDDGEANQVECTVLAYDHPAVFAIVTGILASAELNIVAGDIFTYAPATAAAPRQPRRRLTDRRATTGHRRRIVDHFSCILHQTSMPMEKWRQLLRDKFRAIFLLLETSGQRQQAKRKVDEMVAERLAALEAQSGPSIAPVSIDVDNQAGPFTRLKVVSEDTPAFLYAFSNALALRNLSIEQVKIRTLGSRIEDEIDIVDGNGEPIQDDQRLNRIKLSALMTKHFTYFLGASPNPFDALCRFERMLDDILSLPEQGKWTDFLAEPRILKDLARLLGASDFMWEDFIRQQYESLLPMMAPQVQGRRFSRTADELAGQLSRAVAGADTLEEKKRRLNEFKDREIFMIDLDHILTPEVDFKEMAAALTRLAEAVVGEAAAIAFQYLSEKHGTPRTVAGLATEYAILGLGKMGGAALGYASDIELLLVYSDNGQTDGDRRIGNPEFFNNMVQQIIWLIESKQAGIFNIDLRLRPHGNDGSLACSLESFCRYYGQGGGAHSFERLALVRLRRLVGNRELGERVERIRDDIVYFSRSIDLAELRELRARQFREKTEEGRVNAKFSPGGLVDLEYDVQILQVMYGRDSAALRTPRLHQALSALAEAGVISDEESRRLTSAYDFLRRLINGLRMLRGSARDLFLPAVESDEFTHLARRMGYRRGEDLSAAQQLRLDFDTWTAAVRIFVERHFGRESLPGPAVGNIADLVLSDNLNHELARQVLRQAGYRNPERALVNLRRLCRYPGSRETFARLAILACDLLRHQPDPDLALNNWEKFMAEQEAQAAYYSMLLSQPRRLEILLAIFSASQFLADTLARNRQFLDWLTRPEVLHEFRTRQEIERDLRACTDEARENEEQWLDQLRIIRRRELLRIGARDICLHLSTEEIIAELSHLAEAVLQVALEQVQREMMAEHPEIADFSAVTERFCILALGKLGGGELNYSSDIDLLAVCRPQPAGVDAKEEQRVFGPMMERVCAALNRHTGEGYAYRVDLRLRPYGTSGELVHTLDSLVEYYQKSAGLWEIQALLKLRPIAGNLDLGGELAKRLAPIIAQPRLAGEIADSIERMRQSAIKNANHRTIRHGIDVKNGRGGLRDIEFLVQARQLQLLSAHPGLLTGHTLTALRELARTGAIPADTAEQLVSDYLFLRRLEHCLQIFEDRQIHSLPTTEEELTGVARRLLGAQADHSQLIRLVEECTGRVRREYQRSLALLSPNE